MEGRSDETDDIKQLARPDWKQVIATRVEHARLFPAVWLGHQSRDDPFWKNGSVCYCMDRLLDVPILVASGYADSYPDVVYDLVESECKFVYGVLGPWGHQVKEMCILLLLSWINE